MRETEQTPNYFDVLRKFVRRPSSAERCEMCTAELSPHHQHLLEPAIRRLLCACEACAILFGDQTRYKRVPRRIRFLADFHITDGQWDGLMMPINMAFFFKSSIQGRVIALYPSPAGATESLLSLESWEDIVSENQAVEEMEADVEALLVNRIGYARGLSGPEYYVVPIDECFKLVGLIRSRWQGLSGGAEVWREIGQFFVDLKSASCQAVGGSHA